MNFFLVMSSPFFSNEQQQMPLVLGSINQGLKVRALNLLFPELRAKHQNRLSRWLRGFQNNQRLTAPLVPSVLIRNTGEEKQINRSNGRRMVWMHAVVHLINMGAKRGGLHSTKVAYLLLTQQPRVQFNALSVFSWCYWDLLTVLLRTVDRGLIMSIEPI